MKNEAERINDGEAIAQVIREAKHLSKERREELLSAIRYLPKAKRNIEPSEVQEWHKLHQHADKYHGAIGGHITKTECYTSIGTFETYKCSSCGEEAFV